MFPVKNSNKFTLKKNISALKKLWQIQALVVKEQEEKKRQIEEAMFFSKVESDAEIRKLKIELVHSGKLELGKEDLEKELIELKLKCEEDKQKAIQVENIRRQLESDMESLKLKKNAEMAELREQIQMYRVKFQEKAEIMEKIEKMQQRRKWASEVEVNAKKVKEELDLLESQGKEKNMEQILENVSSGGKIRTNSL